MDKNIFKTQSFEDAADHQKIYNAMDESQKRNLFFHLMQTAYGFVGDEWPKMEKIFVKERLMIINEKTKNQCI